MFNLSCLSQRLASSCRFSLPGDETSEGFDKAAVADKIGLVTRRQAGD